MGRDLRIYLLAVGLPALVLAGAGIRLVQIEMHRAARASAMHRVKAQAQQSPRARAQNQTRDRGPNPLRDKMHRRRGAGPRGPRMMRVFTEEDALASERVMWLGGCVVGLLFLSLVSGGWLLARSARKAREDAVRKTDFVSNISHEFKTPLTTICLCAELAQDGALGDERRQKALAAIRSEAERLKGLVLSVLDFSRLERNRRPFNVAPADVAALLREAAEPMRARFAADGLVLRGAEKDVFARVDPAAFKQILVILLDNAAKYAAAGGPVEAGVASVAGGRGAVLTVADRGPGLDAAGLRRAFDRFWRGDDAATAETGGSGLGLAIARELAKGMDAALSAARRDGGGLVFKLELRA